MSDPRARILDGHRRITALLGPTNTGKTHRAIQRMLSHRSGMIGLPLRLLAREVYDRVAAVRGPDDVALVTGEEKRIPSNPSFFVCTVEAMPVDRPVAFLAVDEIQLAGDRQRGHVFTDRLLHARGVLETMFLGSDTIAPLLAELVPSAQITRQPRLSKLSWGGTCRLARVPPRSAVVAFSAADVYRSAERLRAQHGGVAVVMGSLSPRTRNAQVAMYQAGEVQHLVATDAIGMGLNMDVHHVAFADLRKFDGRRFRELHLAEVAQIAGRAGRHTTDGTFGTLQQVGPLEADEIGALQAHRFPPLTHLWWRNTQLDFSTPDALLATLRRRPPHTRLRGARDEDDERTFEDLARRGDLPLDHREAVALLWEVCRVPDFRKTLTGSHADLLHRVAGYLLGAGQLPDDWVANRIAGLDRTEGDLETLMARIAFVRTWTFISNQRGWLQDPTHWQARTRDIEDRLSDALHERLQARFVDARTVVARTRPDAEVTIEDDGTVRLAGHAAGKLTALSWSGEGHRREVQRAIRRGLRTAMVHRVDALVQASDDAFATDLRARIWWRDGVVAQLEAGPSPLEPHLRLARLELLARPERERVRERLEAWFSRRVALLQTDPDAGSGVGQVLARVRDALGVLPLGDVDRWIDRDNQNQRRLLARSGLRLGRWYAYRADWLEPEHLALRSTLWSVAQKTPTRLIPGGAPPCFPQSDRMPAGWLRAVGYIALEPVVIRVDIFEKWSAKLRNRQHRGTSTAALAQDLGLSTDLAHRVRRTLTRHRTP